MLGQSGNLTIHRRMSMLTIHSLQFKVHGKPAVPVESVEDAAEKWNRYRLAMGAQGLGCSDIGNGGVVRSGNDVVAKISYNGRIWAGE